MALATSEWRESFMRSARIQASNSATKGATRLCRAARRLTADSPLISRSTSKTASISLYRFERQRREHGQLAARLGGDIGEHEELAPAVRPAGGFGDGLRFAAGLVEPLEAGIGIGLQDSRIAGEMAPGMLTRAIT